MSVAQEHVDLEALLEGLALEEGLLQRVAQGADGIGEDVVEHGLPTLLPRGSGDMSAVATDMPRSRWRSVAMRRPSCTASLASPSRTPSRAPAASRSVTVMARPKNPGSPSPALPGWPTTSRMTSPRRKNTWRIGAP